MNTRELAYNHYEDLNYYEDLKIFIGEIHESHHNVDCLKYFAPILLEDGIKVC